MIGMVGIAVAAIAFRSVRVIEGFSYGPTSSTPSAQTSDIAKAAVAQIGKTLAYDPSYVALTYPGGDVPMKTGVCADVIVRALRSARKMDLQKLMHEDMASNFSKYPTKWGLKKPDSNIDHRRVPNMEAYFSRKGYSVDGAEFQAGDIVTVRLDGNRPHIMIVSDHYGNPWVVHNIGGGTQEEDRLHEFKIVGHFRIPGK